MKKIDMLKKNKKWKKKHMQWQKMVIESSFNERNVSIYNDVIIIFENFPNINNK
jgi:hypothetical protein